MSFNSNYFKHRIVHLRANIVLHIYYDNKKSNCKLFAIYHTVTKFLTITKFLLKNLNRTECKAPYGRYSRQPCPKT